MATVDSRICFSRPSDQLRQHRTKMLSNKFYILPHRYLAIIWKQDTLKMFSSVDKPYKLNNAKKILRRRETDSEL